jgi:hypothetical protein
MGMSFSACILRDRCFEPVFTGQETSSHLWDGHPLDAEEMPPANPDYRPELDISLSNRNAAFVITSLGYKMEENYHWSAPIDDVIATCEAYVFACARNGKTPGILPSVHSWHGQMPVFNNGVRDGYVEEKAALIAKMAREGLKRGATHVTAA